MKYKGKYWEKGISSNANETIIGLIWKLDITPREKEVLELRLRGEKLKEIAILLNISLERVRQIESKACRKIKHPTRWGGNWPKKPKLIIKHLPIESKDDLQRRTTIDLLQLPTRIYNSLRRMGIETIEELIHTPEKNLLEAQCLGPKTVSIIKERLELLRK